MKRQIPALLMAVILLALSACTAPFPAPQDSGQTGESVEIYRLADGREELLAPESCPLPQDAPSRLEAVAALLLSPSHTEGLACPFPDGAAVVSCTQVGAGVTLELTGELLEMEGMDRTAAAFCAVMSFCQLDGVESVTIAAGGQSLFYNLTPADALLRDTDTDPYARQLRLYFADSAGRYLVSEYRSLTLDEDAAPERYVLEELLRGPSNPELQSPLPEGTRLLSCETEDGVCTVDLSGEFYENRPQTALGERLALGSIVNSLTALSQVSSVMLLVEGESLSRYVYRPLDTPLVRYDAAVGPAAVDRGELDTDLYLALPGLQAIAPLPWRVDPAAYDSAQEAVLSALLSAAEPGYPTLFSGSGTVGRVSQMGSTCAVDLSESFLASLPPDNRNAAVQSMAASLCALDGVEQVLFTIGGRPALFDGADWSGPWSEFDLAEETSQ